MLLCYMVVERAGKYSHELCLVPDKVDALSKPILIDELEPNPAAVFRVGAEEALIVMQNGDEKILSGLEPSLVYLTPNLSAFPGIRAKYVKIVKTAAGYKTYYSKDKQKWEEWVANRERV